VTLQRIGLKVQRREVKKQLKQRVIKETMQLLSKFERTRANRRGVPFKTITSKLVFTKKEVRKRLGYQRLRVTFLSRGQYFFFSKRSGLLRLFLFDK